MVLGALLAFSAASYYAKRKGIPVEEVFSWNTCSCSSDSTAATATTTAEDEEDWIETRNNNGNIISYNNDLLLQTNYSNGSLERIRRKNHHRSQQQLQQACIPLQ
jgi:hypothetical protein